MDLVEITSFTLGLHRYAIFAICTPEHFCFSAELIGIFLFVTFCFGRIVCVGVCVVMFCALCFIKIEWIIEHVQARMMFSSIYYKMAFWPRTSPSKMLLHLLLFWQEAWSRVLLRLSMQGCVSACENRESQTLLHILCENELVVSEDGQWV